MRTIRFTRYRFIAVGLSLFCMIFGLLFTVFYHHGLNMGVDFNPGVSIQFAVRLPEPITEENETQSEVETIAVLRELLAPYEAQIQEIPNRDPLTREYRVRMSQVGLHKPVKAEEGVDPESVMTQEEVAALTPLEKLSYDSDFTGTDFAQLAADEVERVVEAEYGADSVEIKQQASVTPSRAATLTTAAVWVVVAAMALVMVYVWFRFRFSFAVGAMAAVFHDVFIMMAFIGIFQVEFTSVTIAALLTMIGYSLNDTIVVFDRVRESVSLYPNMAMRPRLDMAVSQTLSRTVITSLTTLFTVVALYIFAADTSDIKSFALNLIVGIVSGTYSTIFIASPVYYWVESAVQAGKRRRAAKKYGEKAVAAAVSETAGETGADAETEIPLLERKVRGKKRRH